MTSEAAVVVPATDVATTISPQTQPAVIPIPDVIIPDKPTEAPQPVTVDSEVTRTEYWVRGVLVHVTPEKIVIDLRNAKKPAGVPSQDALNLTVPASTGPLHLALASAPDDAQEKVNETQQTEPEVPNGVQMSEGQQPSTGDDLKDEPRGS